MLELTQVGAGQGLYLPLLLDWHPRRRAAAAEWRSLTVTEVRLRDGSVGFATDGTPVDCVRFADLGLVGERPDLIVSGINYGVNLGDTAIDITMETRGPDHIAELLSALSASGYVHERIL